jgi:hypothetical protein
LQDLEFQFQKELVNELKKFGWSAYHPGGIQGLPDLLCFKAPNLGVMIELKVLNSGDENRAIKNKFQPVQKPFYLNQIKETGVPVILVFKSFEDIETYHIVSLRTEYSVHEFFKCKCSVVMNGLIYNVNSLAEHLEIVIGWA